MIVDELYNLINYSNLSLHLKAISKYFSTIKPAMLTDGKHDIGSSGVYALVREYHTLPASECCIECHKKNIDIQIVVAGQERIGYSPRSLCAAKGEYDPEKDFQKLEGPLDWITLRPGLFALFFPHDGHMPGVRCSEAAELVRKIVVKVPAEV
jgi:YhcH/YjgK/YiaL family protein